MLAFCYATFRHEINSAMFDLVEHAPNPPPPPSSLSVDKAGGNADSKSPPTLDIGKTVLPRPHLLFVGAKVFIMAWVISSMVMSILDETHKSFWLAYLTFWVMTVTAAYTIMSCVTAIYLAMRLLENPRELEGGFGLLVKTTWALLSVIAPAGLVVTIWYWPMALLFDGDKDYESRMTHGGCMVLVMIDGFFISRFRLRLKQFVLYQVFMVVYMLWSVIHAYSGLNNPYKNDGTQTDDGIYQSTLAWKNSPVMTSVLVLIMFFIVNPVVFLLLRAVSRLAPRRLCAEDKITSDTVRGDGTLRSCFDNLYRKSAWAVWPHLHWDCPVVPWIPPV